MKQLHKYFILTAHPSMDSSEPVADKGGERIGGCYGYLRYRDLVRATKVTNDVVERGIAMIQAFAHTVKDKEAQLQWLLLEMEAHRRSLKFHKRSLATLYNMQT